MTDLEQLLNTFVSLDIGVTFDSDENGIHLILKRGNKNVSGYFGFQCSFSFDTNGKFKSVGIYE